MESRKYRIGLLGALLAFFSGTANDAQAITLPSFPTFYVTVVESDFSAPGSTVYNEHFTTSTGTQQNEIHLIATVVLSSSVVGQNTPLSVTSPRLKYHVRIIGAPNPAPANLGHLKACQQAALLAASNPAKFKLVLSYISTTYKDVNDSTLATQINLLTDAAFGAGYSNVRCSLTRR